MERATDADIAYAYRLLLKREPDPAGLEHYQQHVRDGISLGDLVASFVRSDEFHERLERERLDDEVEIACGGYRMLARRSDSEAQRLAGRGGAPEDPAVRAFGACLSPGAVCVDVGAKTGAVTLLAASLVKDAGRVISVEADPDRVQRLYRNVILNGFTNVDVLPLAASDRREMFSLEGRAHPSLAGAPDAAGRGRFVQSMRLDDACGDLPRLDVVRMDVAGHEPRALRGFERNVTTHRPVLLLGFNPPRLEEQGHEPLAFLRQILTMYPRVRVFGGARDAGEFGAAEAVVAYWLRDPSRHLDLLAATKSP